SGAGAGASVAPMEPPVAFDAGAGLREMVLRERERLRQQLGLSTASSSSNANSGGGSAGTSGTTTEPKSMLSIFARNGAGSSAGVTPRHAAAAAVAPPPLPLAAPLSSVPFPATTATGSSSNCSGEAGGIYGGGNSVSAAASCSSNTLEEKRSGGSSVGNGSTATCDSNMSGPPSSGCAGESTTSSTASTKAPDNEDTSIARQKLPERRQQQEQQQQGRQQQKHEEDEEAEEDRREAAAGAGQIRISGTKPSTAGTSTCSEVVASTHDPPGGTGQQLGLTLGGAALGVESGGSGASAAPVSAALLPSAAMPPPLPAPPLLELSGSGKPMPRKEAESLPQPQPSLPPQQMNRASSAKSLEIPAASAKVPVEAPVEAAAQATCGHVAPIVFTSVSPADAGLGEEASNAVASGGGQLPARQPPTVASVQPSKPGSAARLALAATSAENLNKMKNGMAPVTAVPAAPSVAAAVIPSMSPIKVKFRAKPIEPPVAVAAAPEPCNLFATEVAATAAPPPPPPPPPLVSTPSEPAIITFTKTRRSGRVITVPAPVTSNRYRGVDQQQQQQYMASKHSHMGSGESSGPTYLTIPASLLSARPQAGSATAMAVMAPPSSLNPGGAAAATGVPTLGGSGAVPAPIVASTAGRNTPAAAAVTALTGVNSGLRPAALSYSPRSFSGQLHLQAQAQAPPPQQQQLQQQTVLSALAITSALVPAAAVVLADSSMPPSSSSSPAPPADATLPVGVAGPYPCCQQQPHVHVQSPAVSLSILPKPHLKPPATPAAPPPPPGFAPRPMSGKPPQPPPTAATALAAAAAPLPTQNLTSLVHAPAATPAGSGLSAPMASAADVTMPEMENLVLSVVDQGLEESVGLGALGDRLMLGGGEVGSDSAPGLVANGGVAVQAAGGGGPTVPDGLWPHPRELTAAAMLPPGGLQTDRMAATAGAGGPALVDTQPLGIQRNIRHAPAGPLCPQPAGTMHAATAPSGPCGGSVTAGAVTVSSGPFLGASVAAAMAHAYSGELGSLGGLLERSSSLAAPAAAGGGDVALAAAGAVLDHASDQASGTVVTASGGIASSRTASQHTLNRYDSGTILGQPSHGHSVALFSANVWAADGGAAAKGGPAGAAATAAGGMDGGGSSERRSAHGDSWVVMAEAQQLQLSQAMEALANGPGSASATTGAVTAVTAAAAAGSFAPPGSTGLLTFAGAPLMPLPAVPVTGATATATDAGGGADAAPAPSSKADLPLPDFPALLFDYEHNHQRASQNLDAGNGCEPAGDASGTALAAGSGGTVAAAGMGPWASGPPGGLMSGPAGRPGSSGMVAGVDGHPPPPPPGGVRPMMFGAAGPSAVHPVGSGVNASIGMGQLGVSPQVPYGHAPGVMYPPAMGPHAVAAFGGGHHPGYPNTGPGPYGDWYGAAAAGPYGGFRPQMMVSTPGGMFGNAAQAAAMSGARSGGLMPPSHASQAPTAQGSFTSSPHPHTNSHALTVQQSQQGAAPAAAQASAWFIGGGSKAAALSGMGARVGGGGGGSGGSSSTAGSSGSAGKAEAASAGPVSGASSGGGTGSGSSSGVRHSHSRSGKGRR
ncbi:hypothetical protein Vafri_9809, partial [Volvox africanus]